MKDLLDVNVLLALAWPNHVSHNASIAWITSRPQKGFVTCPLTECGFIRLSMNPAIVSEPTTIKSVLDLLSNYKTLPGYEFWPDTLEAAHVFSHGITPMGHPQITDAYLLALARKNKGRLVTFDKGILALCAGKQDDSLLILD